MKLLRQVRLRSVQGTTTAVFEVDLCEVGEGQFVVNFRYGRRGAKLTDGTKTALPVSRDEAERAFNRTVQEKKRKGYVDADAGLGGVAGTPRERVDANAPSTVAAPSEADPRAATLVRYLEGKGTRNADTFPMHRVVWRAGELRLAEAVPALLELLRKGHPELGRRSGPPWQYGVVWALARVGNAAAVTALTAAEQDNALTDATRRVAAVGLLDALDGDAREGFVRRQADRLPAGVARALEAGPDAVTAAVATHLQDADTDRYDILFRLYLVDRPASRRVVLDHARTVPLRDPAFRVVRHLLKAAELRGDGELLGIMAHRLETTKANPSPWNFDQRKSAAYQRGTRVFLRRRVWRTLRRLGELGSDEYVDLATGVLLAFSDVDARGAEPSDRAFSHLWPLANVLFHNDPAFGWTGRSLHLFSTGRSSDADARTEAFPELWDAHPNALVALMRRSRCAPVHRFAARAFRANREAWSALATATAIELLGVGYDATVRLAADIAIDRYSADHPDFNLVLALATCSLPDIRKTAHTWVSANPRPFLDDPAFTVGLALAPHSDTRVFARNILSSALMLPAAAQGFVARLLAELIAGGREEQALLEIGRDVESLLQTTFSAQARTLGLDVIRDLLSHPLEGLQHLGATLLIAHDTRPADLPEGLLPSLLLSAHASIRALGVRLFGELPDATLLERCQEIVDLCRNPHAEVRQAVRPIVGRLARSNPSFAKDVLDGIVATLAQPEAQEGLHADLVALVRGELQQALAQLPLPLVWKLLQAGSSLAQELGGQLLERNVGPDELEIWRIAKLASHEIRSVRHAAWAMYRGGIARVRRELEPALTILDASWDDSRQFAFEFFEQHFSAADFTPALLVSVCDSVRPDVQQYGRKLITRFFSEVDGPKYLLELSQHPSTEMQLFATHYLERYAGNHPDRIEALRWYFGAVLVGVNRGRAAKQRVLAFLRQEAGKHESVARLVTELLTELARTISVEYRGAAIEILCELRVRYPKLDVPLTMRTPPRRPRRAV